jgi:hypothetical protein
VFDGNAGGLGTTLFQPSQVPVEWQAALQGVGRVRQRISDVEYEKTGTLTVGQRAGEVEGVIGRLGEVRRVEDTRGSGHQPLL